VQSDTLKLLFTYTIALVIVVGGGLFLYATLGQSDAESTRLAIVGFMGGATAFVFAQESAKQATRSAQSSVQQGTDSTTKPEG
jgi:hypothetical protein